MNKLDLEMYDKAKFVRMGEEIKLGSYHLFIVNLMLEGDKLWTLDTNSVSSVLYIRKKWNIIMQERFNNDTNLVDMGLIVRTKDGVFVGQTSSTFDYPCPDVFEKTRMKTIEVLGKLYSDDKFIRGNR